MSESTDRELVERLRLNAEDAEDFEIASVPTAYLYEAADALEAALAREANYRSALTQIALAPATSVSGLHRDLARKTLTAHPPLEQSEPLRCPACEGVDQLLSREAGLREALEYIVGYTHPGPTRNKYDAVIHATARSALTAHPPLEQSEPYTGAIHPDEAGPPRIGERQASSE